jgi:hypothetical protein
MPSDPPRPSEPQAASPGEDELVFGAYSSPPCFLHELDPSYLDPADAPAWGSRTTAAGAAGPFPDDIPMPDGPRQSWSFTADADRIAPSGSGPDGASACSPSATSSLRAGPTPPSR